MCDEDTNTDDFEEINKKRGKVEMNPFGTTGGRELYSLPRDALDRVDRDVALAAAKILPELSNETPLEYRFAVVRQFVEYEEMGQKRLKGKPFRTASERRLDRAFTEVAAAHDRSESTIRAACTKAYKRYNGPTGHDYDEKYETDNPTAEFREDCWEILECVRQARENQ